MIDLKAYPSIRENKNLKTGYRSIEALAWVRGIQVNRLLEEYEVETNRDGNGQFFNVKMPRTLLDSTLWAMDRILEVKP